MFLFVLKYWRVLLVGAIAFGIGFKAGYFVGEYYGKKLGKQEVRVERLEEDLKVRDKYVKIRNNRPDNTVLNDRLRSGTF